MQDVLLLAPPPARVDRVPIASFQPQGLSSFNHYYQVPPGVTPDMSFVMALCTGDNISVTQRPGTNNRTGEYNLILDQVTGNSNTTVFAGRGLTGGDRLHIVSSLSKPTTFGSWHSPGYAVPQSPFIGIRSGTITTTTVDIQGYVGQTFLIAVTDRTTAQSIPPDMTSSGSEVFVSEGGGHCDPGVQPATGTYFFKTTLTSTALTTITATYGTAAASASILAFPLTVTALPTSEVFLRGPRQGVQDVQLFTAGTEAFSRPPFIGIPYSPPSTTPPIAVSGTPVGSETPNTTVDTSLVIDLASNEVGATNYVWLAANGAGGVDPAPTTPAGWTLLGSGTDGTGPPSQAWLYRAPAGTSGTTTFALGTNACAVSWAYTGLNATTPEREVTIGVQAASSTDKDTETITSLGSWIVSGWADRNGGNYTAATDTFRASQYHTSSSAVYVQDSDGDVTAGSQQRTSTGPLTGAGVDFIFELVPAAGLGGGPQNYMQALSGALSFTGTVVKQTARSLRSLLTTQNEITDDDTISFEGGTLGLWDGTLLINDATLAVSTVRSSYGERSMLITWPTSTLLNTQAWAQSSFLGRGGHTYKMTARVWVPSGSVPVAVSIYPLGTGSASSTTDAWEDITYTGTLSGSGSTTLSIVVVPASDPTAGHQVYVDHVKVEDLTGGMVKQILRPHGGSITPFGGRVPTGVVTKRISRALAGNLLFNPPYSGSLVFNNFEGGTPATALTTGNTGGISGTAFSAIIKTGTSTVDFVTSPSLSGQGSLSAKLTATGGNAYLRWDNAVLGSLTTPAWAFSFNYDSLPSAYASLIEGKQTDSGTLSWRVSVSSLGNFRVFDTAGAVLDSTTTAPIVPGTNYVLQGSFNHSTGAWFVDLYTEAGSLVETLSGAGASFGTQTQQINLGRSATADYTITVDDYAIGTSPFGERARSFNKVTTRALVATLAFVGSFFKSSSRAFSAALSFVGSLTPTFTGGGPILKSLSASLSFTGTTTKRTGRAAAGTLSFTGAATKRASRALSGALNFNGAGYAASVLADTPVGYWRLGEPSGTTMTDSSGNGRDGTYGVSVALGGAGLQTSDSDTSAQFFSGASSSASVTYASWMGTGNDFSAEAFANIDSASVSGNRTIMSIYNGSGFSTARFTFRLESGVPKLYVFHSSSFSSVSGATTLAHSTIYHLAATYDGSVAKVYVNGVEDGSSTLSVTPNAGSVDLRLHSTDSNSEAFVGDLDEAAYYDYALSPSQVAAHYAARSASYSALSKRTGRGLAASLTFVGSLARRVSRALSAALGFTGNTTKRTARSLAGGLSFTGSVVSSSLFFRSLSGALSFTGSQTKRTGKALAGGLSFVGATTKRNARALPGALSFTGTTTKRTLRALSGGISFVGSTTRASVFARALSGSLSFTGTQTKQTSKALGGALSFAGGVSKRTARALAGALSFSGGLASILNGGGTAYSQSLSASLSFTGAQAKRTARSLAGALSFTGAMGKQIPRTLTGALSFAGATTKRTGKALSGGVSFVGSQTKKITRPLAASLSFVGAATKRTARSLAGSLGFTGSITRSFSKSLSGGLSFVGSQTKRTARALAGVLSFTGSLLTQKNSGPQLYLQSLDASLSFTGAITKRTARALAGTLSFAGSITRGRFLALAASLGFTGAVAKRTSRPLSAALSFTGSQVKRTSRALSGALSFVGTTTKQTRKALGGALSFVGTTATGRIFFRSFNAALSFTGGITKRTGKSLGSVLSFIPGFSYIANILNPPPVVDHPDLVLTCLAGDVVPTMVAGSTGGTDHAGSLVVASTGTSILVTSGSGDIQ